jgi:hypothetical protein
MTNENNLVIRKSGYDPATQVCWDFRNKGDRSLLWSCKCPACTAAGSLERELFFFGRCRSGKRWFWRAGCYLFREDRLKEKLGWADGEEIAIAAAMAAVLELKNPEIPAIAQFNQGAASRRLKELNTEKRAARPAPNTSDARITEYLYGHTIGGEDSDGCPVRFRINKKTAKRIYYVRHAEYLDAHGEPRRDVKGNDYGRGYVDRQKLEADGSVRNRGVHWSASDSHLYPSFEALMGDRYREPEKPDLAQLKAEMAAAHPDKGGSSAAFIAARKAYVEARRRARAAS